MLKLYGGARSRASIVHWYLEELGLPYTFERLDMQAGEHRQPAFLALNPFGKVPVLQDGDVTLFESGAILLYLAQTYDPTYPSQRSQQAELYQWILFANSTLSMGVSNEATREQELPKLLGPLSDRLLLHPFITGDTFSVTDVALGAVLAYIPLLLKLDLSPYPGVVDYNQRLAERPAFAKTILYRSAT
jgi:glutathione S-transferase